MKRNAKGQFVKANAANSKVTAKAKVGGGHGGVKPVKAKKAKVAVAKPVKLTNFIGISRDHSGSMRHLVTTALKDYNSNLDTIKNATINNKVDTIMSVMRCGHADSYGGRTENRLETVNQPVASILPITSYNANGSNTPLFDSIVSLINTLKSAPGANDPGASFVVMAITDGQDNASMINGTELGRMIQELEATDRWTFAFRVPTGYKSQLQRHGISPGNILEWDLSEKGLQVASAITAQAFDSFYAGKTRGVNSTKKFFTDLSEVKISDVKATLNDISNEIQTLRVTSNDDGEQIRDFVQKQVGSFRKGTAFYQLSKTEKVQDHKILCIKDKKKATVYAGQAARDLLGIPHTGEIKLAPGDHGNYHIFVQSTSVNRKVEANTSVIYWPKAQTPIK